MKGLSSTCLNSCARVKRRRVGLSSRLTVICQLPLCHSDSPDRPPISRLLRTVTAMRGSSAMSATSTGASAIANSSSSFMAWRSVTLLASKSLSGRAGVSSRKLRTTLVSWCVIFPSFRGASYNIRLVSFSLGLRPMPPPQVGNDLVHPLLSFGRLIVSELVGSPVVSSGLGQGLDPDEAQQFVSVDLQSLGQALQHVGCGLAPIAGLQASQVGVVDAGHGRQLPCRVTGRFTVRPDDCA